MSCMPVELIRNTFKHIARKTYVGKWLSFIIMKNFNYSTDIRDAKSKELRIKEKNSVLMLSINNVFYVCRTCTKLSLE